MNWIRDTFDCIDLVANFDEYYAEPENMKEVDIEAYHEAIRFLIRVEAMSDIKSRQVAAMALSNAYYIFWSDV